MLRARQQTITFTALDSTSSTGATKSGLALLATDVKIIRDTNLTAVPATNAPVEVGATGRYSLVLTAAETNCAWVHVYVEKSGMRPCDFGGSMDEQPAGAVVADGANSATVFVTNLASAVPDFYKDCLVSFTTGALAGSGPKKVTGYNGASKALTFAAGFTGTPAAGDLFILQSS